MNNNTDTKNTNITVDGRNLSCTFALWNNVKQSATTINELTESMSKDFRKPETYKEFTSMNRDVKKILQTAITLKRNMDVITGRLEAAMIIRDANQAAAARLLSDCEDDIAKEGIAKEEPVKAPESPQNEPEGVETAYTAKMEETPAKPVVEPPKVKTPVFSFIPTLCDTNFDVLTLDGFSTIPYAVGVRVTGEHNMHFQYGLLAVAIKKVIDTLNDVMIPAAALNPFPAKPEDFINGVYCGFKNVKFTIIKHADWVPEGSTAVTVTVEHENGGFSCTTGRNVVVCKDLQDDVLEHGLKALAEGANTLLAAVSQQSK